MTANVGHLAGKVIFITGGSRGIGRAIALKAASDGAKITIAAKTKEPHPKLPGTIYTVADEIKALGGECLPCIVDIRHEDQVEQAVEATVKSFGKLDILINNASAISLTNTPNTPMKTFDLMMSINTRGTYLCSKAALPHLQKSALAHILNLSPPLNMSKHWFGPNVAYTMSKYGMSMCVLGMAEEFKPHGIAVNALWPRTAVYTAAMKMLAGGNDDIKNSCRKDNIMADAAYLMLAKGKDFTGNFCIDEDVIRKDGGLVDLSHYAYDPKATLIDDFFLGDGPTASIGQAPSVGSSSSSDSGASEIEIIFRKLESLLNPDLVASIKASFGFNIDGVGSWFINLKQGQGSLGRVEGGGLAEAKNYDCVLEMKPQVFTDVFKGKISPTKAFMGGQMKIKGNMMSAMKLEGVMKKMPKT